MPARSLMKEKKKSMKLKSTIAHTASIHADISPFALIDLAEQ